MASIASSSVFCLNALVENASEWIRAGAVAVGVGSALLDAASIAARDYAGIAARARRLIDGVAAAKGAK